MPTGYTASVQDGSVTDFADFARSCTRGMGVAIMQRDDSPAVPLITRYEPNTDYADRALAAARTKRDQYDARTHEDWQQAMVREDAESQRAWRESVSSKRLERERYEAMLDKVQAWQPPTSEHDGLKKFMTDQLTESIRFDCTPWEQPARLTDVVAYKADSYKSVNRDIDYYGKARREEIERTASRNAWLTQFVASLPGSAPTVQETK